MVRSVRFHRERSDASATTLQAGRERPGSSSHSVVSSASTTATSEAWRKPGKVLRERLVQEDEAHGGKSFTLSPDCPIDRYYRVADKVLDQFLQHPVDTREELMEAYLVGTRLSKFLDSVLPTHPDYDGRGAVHSELREQSQEQLVAVHHYLEKMAFILDKQEHENYISKVLETDLGSGAPTYNTTLISTALAPSELDALDLLVEQNESSSGLAATTLSTRFENSDKAEYSRREECARQESRTVSPETAATQRTLQDAESRATAPKSATKSQQPIVSHETTPSSHSYDPKAFEQSEGAVDWSFSATEEFSEEWLNMSFSLGSSQFDSKREPPPGSVKKRLTAVVEDFDPFSPGSPGQTTLKMNKESSQRLSQEKSREASRYSPSNTSAMENRIRQHSSSQRVLPARDFGLDTFKTRSMYSPPVRQQAPEAYRETKIERRFRETQLDDNTKEYLARNSALLSAPRVPRDDSPTSVVDDFGAFYDWDAAEVEQKPTYSRRNNPKSSLLHYDKLGSLHEESSSRMDYDDRELSSMTVQGKRGALAPLKDCVRCLLE